jgi:hypothetical protein
MVNERPVWVVSRLSLADIPTFTDDLIDRPDAARNGRSL